MRTFRLRREQRVERPLDQVFEFFSDPTHLEALTPGWLRFRVVGRSDEPLGEGTLIDYRLQLHGVPLRWRSAITAWNPPYGFTDEQLIGPYRRWVHVHSFRAELGATVAVDEVEYAVPGGALVERLFVRRDLDRIFAHRAEQLPRLLGC